MSNQDSMEIIKANQNIESYQKRIFKLEAENAELEKENEDSYQVFLKLREENYDLKRRESERGEVLKQYQIWHSDNVRKIVDLETEKREISTLCKDMAYVCEHYKCGFCLGNPMYRDHTDACKKAKQALEKFKEVVK